MYNPDGQYICITKQSNNLNIEYQKHKNKTIDATNRSSFLISNNDAMGEDVLFKIQSLQKNTPYSYIATFVEDETQYIVPKGQVVEEGYITKKLNDEIDIAVSKNKLFELSYYYKKTGIDYLFSPFSILNEHNIQNPESNALIILIYNNKLYCLIVDGFAKILYSKVLSITQFDDIQSSQFYEDAVMKQNLYDEVYQLELINNIKNIMAEFYEKNDLFIEKINILYTVKQLHQEQITKIQNELMLKIDYHPISMDEVVFEMIKNKNVSLYNFTSPKVVKKDSKQSYIIILSIFIVLGAIFYLVTSYNDLDVLLGKEKEAPKKEIIKKETKKEEVKKPKIEVEKVQVKLPNHREKNAKVWELVNSLLETIPYDMVLQKMEINRNSSIMYGSLITKDLYTKSLKNELLDIYKDSQIEFINDKKTNGEFKAKITNSDLKPMDISSSKNIQYSNKIFLSREEVSSTLNNTLPDNSLITFDSLFKSEFITFNYKVELKASSPKEFFETIEKLDKLSNSIHINYPIVFEMKNNLLEIDFNIQVHQYK